MAVKKRAVIASGGTGGHFYPGFALAVELRRRGWETLFLVKKDDIARPALEEAGFPYAELDMVALPRSLNPLAHASFLVKLLRTLGLARRILADFRPNAVIGTGSYVAFPAVLAARLAGIPAYIHESNAKYGLGNRLAGTFCSQAALGLPIEDNPLASKSELLGTPVRETFSTLPPKETARTAMGLEPDKFTVLVFGGSQGARRLNAAFIKALKDLKGDIQSVHLAGRNNFEAVKAEYAKAGLAGLPGAKLMDYTEDMPALYAAADLVVARSGASTVAELAQLGKASCSDASSSALWIPLPSSAAGHQEANARTLSGAGAAVCLEESEDFDAGLAAALRAFLEEPGKAAALSENLKKAGIPPGLKAAAAFADLIEGK